jgi:hypothetical protein
LLFISTLSSVSVATSRFLKPLKRYVLKIRRSSGVQAAKKALI